MSTEIGPSDVPSEPQRLWTSLDVVDNGSLGTNVNRAENLGGSEP